MIVNAYYDKESGYAHFSSLDLYNIWGFKKDSLPKWLKKLEEAKVIENCTCNGYFKRYKILKFSKIPRFIINKELENIDKEFLLKCLQNKITKELSNNECQRRLYGINSTGNSFRNRLKTIENRYNKNFWELFDCTSISDDEYLTPTYGNKTDKGYHYYGTNTKSKTISEENKISCKILSKIRHRARKSNKLQVTIDQEYLEKLLENQNYKDYYTGLQLNEDDWSADRIDCSKGYIEGNIVLTHKIINIMRNNQTIEEFKNNIIALYNNINNF